MDELTEMERAAAPRVEGLNPEQRAWILERSRAMHAEASATGLTAGDRFAVFVRHEREATQAYREAFGDDNRKLPQELMLAAVRADQPEVFREIFGDGDGHAVPVVGHVLAKKVREVLPGFMFVTMTDDPEDVPLSSPPMWEKHLAKASGEPEEP